MTNQFEVSIKERIKEGWKLLIDLNRGGDLYTYRVTLDEEFAKQLGPEETPEQLIRRSFDFLLAREGPEQILAEFNLRDVKKYFPDFEDTMQKIG